MKNTRGKEIAKQRQRHRCGKQTYGHGGWGVGEGYAGRLGLTKMYTSTI